MSQEKTKTIRIEKERHNILIFYCKFKGKTVKKYIQDKIDKDPALKKFKRRVEDLCFKYEGDEED